MALTNVFDSLERNKVDHSTTPSVIPSSISISNDQIKANIRCGFQACLRKLKEKRLVTVVATELPYERKPFLKDDPLQCTIETISDVDSEIIDLCNQLLDKVEDHCSKEDQVLLDTNKSISNVAEQLDSPIRSDHTSCDFELFNLAESIDCLQSVLGIEVNDGPSTSSSGQEIGNAFWDYKENNHPCSSRSTTPIDGLINEPVISCDYIEEVTSRSGLIDDNLSNLLSILLYDENVAEPVLGCSVHERFVTPIKEEPSLDIMEPSNCATELDSFDGLFRSYLKNNTDSKGYDSEYEKAILNEHESSYCVSSATLPNFTGIKFEDRSDVPDLSLEEARCQFAALPESPFNLQIVSQSMAFAALSQLRLPPVPLSMSKNGRFEHNRITTTKQTHSTFSVEQKNNHVGGRVNGLKSDLPTFSRLTPVVDGSTGYSSTHPNVTVSALGSSTDATPEQNTSHIATGGADIRSVLRARARKRTASTSLKSTGGELKKPRGQVSTNASGLKPSEQRILDSLIAKGFVACPTSSSPPPPPPRLPFPVSVSSPRDRQGTTCNSSEGLYKSIFNSGVLSPADARLVQQAHGTIWEYNLNRKPSQTSDHVSLNEVPMQSSYFSGSIMSTPRPATSFQPNVVDKSHPVIIKGPNGCKKIMVVVPSVVRSQNGSSTSVHHQRKSDDNVGSRVVVPSSYCSSQSNKMTSSTNNDVVTLHHPETGVSRVITTPASMMPSTDDDCTVIEINLNKADLI